MPLNAVHHDEGEVAFITLQELLATAASSSTPPTFFICSAPFFSSCYLSLWTGVISTDSHYFSGQLLVCVLF
jgi:hypothetical protein